MPDLNIPLGGRSPVDVCLEILAGLHSGGEDDRRLQMAACYFLAQNASPEDECVLKALESKLDDDRYVCQHIDDNEVGITGSDFYVNACAADALAVLGSTIDTSSVQTNHYEQDSRFWSPPNLSVKDGRLTEESSLFDVWGIRPSPHPDSLLRRDFDACAACQYQLWPTLVKRMFDYPYRCRGCGAYLTVAKLRIPPKAKFAAA